MLIASVSDFIMINCYYSQHVLQEAELEEFLERFQKIPVKFSI